MSETLVDWEARARVAEQDKVDLMKKMADLSDAAWDVLSALEGGNVDEIIKARRRLGLVFLDL